MKNEVNRTSQGVKKTKIFNFKARWLLVPLVLMTLGINSARADYSPGSGYTLVTNISSLSTGDYVILFCIQNGEGVTGFNGTKDATVSSTAANWKEYYVTKSTSSFTLKDGSANKFIAAPGGNEFKYGDSGGACTVSGTGLLTCSSRYLFKNGNNYRFYATSSTYTNKFYVYKKSASCTAPTISAHPASATYTVGDSPTALSVTASGTSLTYQWYSNTTATNTGGTSIIGQTSSTYTPSTASNGTFYYYCVVSSGSCSTNSNVATITVNKASATIKLSEAGAESSVSGTHYSGDSYTLPSSTEASCGSKVLVGWSTVTISETDTKPTSNYYDKGASVTLAAGENKFYAVFATASGSGQATWDQTTLAALTGSDIFVFAVDVSGTYYAMPNDEGTTSGPDLTSITVSNSKITSVVPDKLKWNISGNATDGYVFYPNGSTTTWMYCNTTASSSNNDNIRVGTGSRKAWKVNNNGYLYNDDNTTRYFSRNGTTDFRSYVNTNTNPVVPVVFKYTSGTTYSAYSTSCSSTAKTITIVPVAGGTVTTSPSGSAEAGNTVTITLTPDAHYTVGGAPTVVDANSQSVAVSGSGTSYTFTMPNANVTITPATWNPINVTITWHRKTGNTPQVVQEGKSDLTFPNTTDVDADCAPFLGWIEGTSWTDSQDEPATYYEVGDLVPAVNTNIDYTAIYGERETTETAAYVKVTSAPVDWSGDYLIVREIGGEYYVAFDGSLTTLDVNNNYVNVSASGGAIAATNALAAKKWTIAKIGATSDYSIKSASGYYIGCTGTGNGLNSSTSTVYSNTLSYSTDHTVITSSGGPVLQTYNSSRFRYYATSQGAIQLYKLGTAEMETVTYTKNPACTPKYRITVNSVTGGSPSSDKSLEPAGETITLTANTADGYSFAGWTLTHTEGGAAASVTYTTGSASTETAAFTMPAYDVTVTAAYSKKAVTELKVMDGSTVVANTTGSVSRTLNVSTGANKTLDVVITPADAFDHSWTATVTAGGTYASISNVTSDGFRVNGLSQGDATVTVTAPNDGSAKVVTFTVHVTDVLPSEIILKRDGSETPIDALTMYYDAANSRGQYVKVNVSYTPTPTNKGFTFSSADATSVSSHAHAQTNPNFYETLNARKVTSSPVNCTFTSEATGSVTKVLAVTVLPCPADQFVDYIHGNATVTRAAQVSADHWSINTSITTPTLSDAPESSSADCEAGHYHLIGWLPQSIAEALFEAGTPITSETEGLVTAGAEIEASGITWYAIWAKKE